MTRHFACIMLLLSGIASGQEQLPSIVIDSTMHDIRNGADVEWSSFPETPEAGEYQISFEAAANATEHTLQLVQEDVKQLWDVTLRDNSLGICSNHVPC